MSNFYANPYGYGYHGFYFDTAEELEEKLETADFEEFEIDCIDFQYPELFKALNIDSGNLDEFLTFVGSLDDDEIIAAQYLAEYCGYGLSDVMDKYRDVYVFCGTPEEYAEEYMAECFDIPENLERYIDYEAFARDCVCGGDWVEYNGYVITNACSL